MVLNFSLKLINNICIVIGALLSVLAIAIASLSIFFIINTSIKIDDNNKFLTNLIGWYYNKPILFEYIKVDRVSESYSFFIEINGFKIDKYENYKNIEVDNIKFNINLSNIFNNKYYLSNVVIQNPKITYNSLKSLQEPNKVIEIFNNILKNIGDLNVYNGILTYIHKDTKYFLSKINFNKNGSTNIDIFGDFFEKCDLRSTFARITLENLNSGRLLPGLFWKIGILVDFCPDYFGKFELWLTFARITN